MKMTRLLCWGLCVWLCYTARSHGSTSAVTDAVCTYNHTSSDLYEILILKSWIMRSALCGGGKVVNSSMILMKGLAVWKYFSSWLRKYKCILFNLSWEEHVTLNVALWHLISVRTFSIIKAIFVLFCNQGFVYILTVHWLIQKCTEGSLFSWLKCCKLGYSWYLVFFLQTYKPLLRFFYRCIDFVTF